MPFMSEGVLHKLLISSRTRDSAELVRNPLLREIFRLMQDSYWSDRRSGSAEYHRCYSVRISNKEDKTASESAFAYMHIGWETPLVGIITTI